jgi:hypothetical protein
MVEVDGGEYGEGADGEEAHEGKKQPAHREGRKHFFFEKKKQKTFIYWRKRPNSKSAAYLNKQKLFGSFFQRGTAFFIGVF